MEERTIVIAEVVGGGVCVAASDGTRVYEAIRNEIKSGRRVRVSFEGITRLTTAFLNAAIGQLYGDFSEQEIREHLAAPVSAEPWHLNRLKLSIERAKSYFRDPAAAKAAFNTVTGVADDNSDH